MPVTPPRAIAVERVRSLVRAPQLRTFPIHAMTKPTRRLVETISRVRPPAVDAKIEHALVLRPVTTDRQDALLWCRGARILHASRELPIVGFDDDMPYDFEIHRLQFIDVSLRIGKVCGMEGELLVRR